MYRCLKYNYKLIRGKREVPRRSSARNSTQRSGARKITRRSSAGKVPGDPVLEKLPGNAVLGKLPRDPRYYPRYYQNMHQPGQSFATFWEVENCLPRGCLPRGVFAQEVYTLKVAEFPKLVLILGILFNLLI